eukprot:s89_g27.t1
MAPGSALERKRAASRRGITLAGDRVVLDVTRVRRKKLFSLFQSWLWTQHGVSLLYLLNEKPADPEVISKWLVEYGKEMYRTGKTYNSYAETVNAIAGARPQIRKQLTQAWDYAFSWIAGEPSDHHPALPAGILIAMMSLALTWGWPQVAAVFGLAWAGVLRIGEVLQATRDDLILPSDALAGTNFALLKIKEPKTRGRHAKHQSARIDPADIIQVLKIAYEKADRQSLLWPQSASTLRKTLRDLLRALKLPTESVNGVRPFDLSSFRPGGASWLLMTTENSELVRRRGRWLSTRVMEIYLQEDFHLSLTHLGYGLGAKEPWWSALFVAMDVDGDGVVSLQDMYDALVLALPNDKEAPQVFFTEPHQKNTWLRERSGESALQRLSSPQREKR